MLRLANKRVVLGVSGGIAAYKSAELIRRLQDEGATVQVVMTEGAKAFITPLTLQALSGRAVRDSVFDTDAERAMGHIELARWADLLVIAPATANCIADIASGTASHLLSTLCLATNAPIIICPAMNQQMWQQAATQRNIKRLVSSGVIITGPDSGSQACGEVGPGRLLDVVAIVQTVVATCQTGRLQGKKVMITAGPTREALDPVRYLTNRSSGKMGYALAQAAIDAGAIVTLISGPTALTMPERANGIWVDSAKEMLDAVMGSVAEQAVVIAAAAVCDYRPVTKSVQKLKKQGNALSLELVQTTDIVASVAQCLPRPYVVGFAAETEQVLAHARLKRQHKGLDMIVANHVGGENCAFDSDNNQVTIIDDEHETQLALSSKSQIARHIIEKIAGNLEREP